MSSIAALLPLIAPLGLFHVAFEASRQPGRDPVRVLRAARRASALGLVVAAVAALLVAAGGPLTSPLLGAAGFGFALRLDGLSAVMLALVAFLGAVVLRYSRAYLDGDPRHGAFVGGLALTIGCVMLLVLSGNLLHLVVLWAATSFALHRLLLFYPERPGAVVAARKKFLVARAGDVCLAAAAVLLGAAFGTGDLGLLLERAGAMSVEGGVPVGVHLAVGLVALSAALKSAQFPTHGWLIEVMETPTPVSALLHAGILNGGTFLVARLGEAVLLSPPVGVGMILVGTTTALFASLAMLPQPAVKTALAYSSSAHMGFMLLLCGLGAFPAALLHLVAHSFYKAHAFLASGSVVEAVRVSELPDKDERMSPLRLAAGLVLALATVAGVGAALGLSHWEQPVALGLASMLAVGLTLMLVEGLRGRPAPLVFGRTVGMTAAVAAAFFVLEAGATRVLAGSVPLPGPLAPLTLGLMLAVIAIFGVVVGLQAFLPQRARSPRWAAAWLALRNGLYANAAFDRFVGALRPVPSPSQASHTSHVMENS